MSLKPRPVRPRHKPRPRSRPRLFQPTPLPLPHAASLPRAQWAPQQVTLEELFMDYSLPQIVQCRTPVLRSHDEAAAPLVQLDMPMLLADQRTARHLLARIVVFDPQNGTFTESKDSVVIPEDYDGHFLRLQSRTTKDKTHVHSLEDIAHDDTPAFLNLSNLTSYPIGLHPRDLSRMIYTVGNVFLVDEPLPPPPPPDSAPNHTHTVENGEDMDVDKDPHDEELTNGHRRSTTSSGGSQHQSATSNSSGDGGGGGAGGERGKSRGGGGGRQTGNIKNGLMRCLDERGTPVLVPTKQMGEVVTIQKREDNHPKLSMKSSEIIANEQFPLLARFAYGKKRPRLTSFSKLFTLLDSFQETSIIACTINGPSIMLMEIPLYSTLQFQVALNRDDLLQIPRLRNALEACRKRGHELSRDIKYKYKFSHRVQETSRRMMKLKDDDDMPSATVRTRLLVNEGYVYI